MTENQISDTILRGLAAGRVSQLPGFVKGHRLPEDHSGRSRQFVEVAGSQQVADQAGALFRALRGNLGYRRKEIELACEGGGASIRTPDFDVTLTLEQDPQVAANYRCVTEVSGFRRPDIVHAPGFLITFSGCCDMVAVRFAAPVDLEAKIDRIEENEELARFLDYDPACSWLSLRLPHLLLEVRPREMICRLPGEPNLRSLITQTEAALERLAGAGVAFGLQEPQA